MVGEEIATGLAVALTAGLAAIALHETAETVRAYSPKNKYSKNKQNKDYQSLIWGE